jgi:hypothetical protein
MTLSLLEAAVGALDTYLEANMSSQLNTLDAEYGDFKLRNIRKWYIGQFPKALPEYPCIAIVGEEWEALEQSAINFRVANRITVVIFEGEDDEQRRFKKLCRYARAVVELCEAGDNSMGYDFYMNGPVTLSEVFTGAKPWIQAVGVPIVLYSFESY